MKNFPAHQLVELCHLLTKTESAFGHAKNTPKANQTLTGALEKGAPLALSQVDEMLRHMELPVSAGYCNKILELIKQKRPLKDLVQLFEQLNSTIRIEITQGLYVAFTKQEKDYLEKGENALGDEVANKLPTVIEDAAEANYCMAFGRYTAAVFHLMRVMEIGVQAFGNKLGVTLLDSHGREKNWQNLLDEANKAIKAMDQTIATTKTYAAIAALLYNVKLAWRNEVMHPKATYTEEEAHNVLIAVKAFIQSLAKVI